MILKVLQANHWNRKRAARALNISYRALLYKIREVGRSDKKLRTELDQRHPPLSTSWVLLTSSF